MKKLIAILAALLILSASLGALAVPAVNRCTLGPFGFTVLADMRRVQSGNGDPSRIEYENGSGDSLVCGLASVEVDTSSAFMLNLHYTSVVSGIGLQDTSVESIDIDGHSAMLWRGAYPVQGGSALRASGLVYQRGASCLVIAFYSDHMPEDNLYDCARQTAESITYVGPEGDEPVEAEPAVDEHTLDLHLTQMDTLGPFTYAYPDEWECDSHVDEDMPYNVYFSPTDDGILSYILHTIPNPPTDGTSRAAFYDWAASTFDYDNLVKDTIELDGETAILWHGTSAGQHSDTHVTGLCYIRDGSYLAIVHFSSCMDEEDAIAFVREIADSIVYSELPAVYQTERIEFSLTGPYLYHDGDRDYVVLGYDWINISDEPQSFGYMITATGYQHGREVSNLMPESFYQYYTLDKFLPGYGTRNYDTFRIDSLEDEVVIYVDDGYDMSGEFEDIKLNVIPSELPEFDGVPNR